MMGDFDYLYKMLLIGDMNVGKSCILKRYVDDEYTDSTIATIGVDFRIKYLYDKYKTVKLQIWDTAGQERFRTITTSYYKGAHCVIIVFDYTNRDSFDNIESWLGEVKKYGSKSQSLYIFGNKKDLPKENYLVTIDEVMELARKHDLCYFSVSAKDVINHDINVPFNAIVKDLIKKTNQRMHTYDKTIKLMKEDKTRKSCC